MTGRGKRELLINRSNRPKALALPREYNGAKLSGGRSVDGENEAANSIVGEGRIELKPLTVGVISL